MLHCGITHMDGGEIVATNLRIALRKDSEKTIPFSPAALNDLITDSQKLLTHLIVQMIHLSPEKLPGHALALAHMEPILKSPWRYKSDEA